MIQRPVSPTPAHRAAPYVPAVLLMLPSLAVAVGAAGVLAACASGGSGMSSGGVAAAAPAATAAISTDTNVFPQPRVVRTGSNGVLDVTLAVDTATLTVPGDGVQLLRTWRLMAANGVSFADSSNTYGFPGPTFEVSPGDSVRILLVNNLPANDSSNTQCENYAAVQAGVDKFQDCFHGPNWTNIHYHGFHVTPDSSGDDVLLQIAPQTQYQYAFGIPAQGQSPGTHWYHPHKHGSVAIQVSNGMSGAFIVRGGGLDSLTAALGMRENLIAVQKVDSALNLMDGDGGVTLVNGASDPIITMRPNEVQRWRIVNENITKTANYEIGFINQSGDEPTMFDVARDGVQFSPANYDTLNSDTTLLMAPGNRLDVFVRAPTAPGLHLLAVRSVANAGARTPQFQAERASAAPSDTLFYVQVVNDGAQVNTTLPATLPGLPPFLANLPGTLDPSQIDTAAIPTIVFIDTFPPGNVRSPSNPGRFYLGNGQNPFMRFNDTTVYIPETASGQELPMLLGQLQTWKVANYGTATNHPFHIHINPFQVIDVVYPRGSADPNAALYAQLDSASQSDGAPIWLDVVPLPLPAVDGSGNVTQPGYVIIRQEYADFTGQYVMHCHILGHEERGMMQVLQVFPNAQSAAQAAAAGYPQTGHGSHAGHGAHPAAGSGAGGGNGRGGGGGNGSGQNRPHQH
jgi:FtsP/CotA-like multicopper oxidase with cupredoxin domain